MTSKSSRVQRVEMMQVASAISPTAKVKHKRREILAEPRSLLLLLRANPYPRSIGNREPPKLPCDVTREIATG